MSKPAATFLTSKSELLGSYSTLDNAKSGAKGWGKMTAVVPYDGRFLLVKAVAGQRAEFEGLEVVYVPR